MSAASGLSPERRWQFLERIAAMLKLRGRRFTDDELCETVRKALTGHIQAAGSAA